MPTRASAIPKNASLTRQRDQEVAKESGAAGQYHEWPDDERSMQVRVLPAPLSSSSNRNGTANVLDPIDQLNHSAKVLLHPGWLNGRQHDLTMFVRYELRPDNYDVRVSGHRFLVQLLDLDERQVTKASNLFSQMPGFIALDALFGLPLVLGRGRGRRDSRCSGD